MYCPKCNAEITGTESACPVCGVPFVQPTTPPTAPNGATMVNPDSVAAAVQNVVMVQALPLQQAAQPMPTTTKKEKRKISPIILIALILFIALGILYLLAFTDFKPVENNNKTTSNTNKSNIEDDGRLSYGGYKFDIPEGYAAKITKNGLEIKGTEALYIIGIDYSNSYDTYKQSYCTKYNTSQEAAEKKLNDRKYLLYNVTDNANGSVFVTDATYHLTAIGMIVRKDNQFAKEENLKFIFGILDKATEKMTEFTPKVEDNIGANGIKIYYINPMSN